MADAVNMLCTLVKTANHAGKVSTWPLIDMVALSPYLSIMDTLEFYLLICNPDKICFDARLRRFN